ncbi:MAG: beta-N-acetylhexosaminidase [Chitinophagaceae bacterium]|nr:beta-N-acetylhexosaminidase [Chitinophagaceae bacterium]
MKKTLLLLFALNATGIYAEKTSIPAPAVKISLIPLPQHLEWTNESFPLNLCKNITINDADLREEAEVLLAGMGVEMPVLSKSGKNADHGIRLILGKVPATDQQDEAYHLVVRNGSITLTANTKHGIFNGIQTLNQLIGENKQVAGCDITDYPAYRWRGYMVDVGRNYQSPGQLKQQIDVMSRYKLNVFHFHLTEDVAWRLQISQYPQLTSPDNMLRNQGKYYTTAEMKDLIRYCKDRHVTLVPEIDMPGHSGAFARAMGVDMQSDSGLRIVRNILREICTTYDIRYIHIGADEVGIRNKEFLPEVSRLIHQYGKQVIGWAPGGNYDAGTIRQLWKDEGKRDIEGSSIKYIDSRFLYLSDMAPESSVVSIFERRLGEKTKGDANLEGAEICLWDDRRVVQESDHLTMNAVYPDMLAFGERSWRGGGYEGVVSDIGPDTSSRAKEFITFERRLMAHKERYFKDLSFPYVRQTQHHWKLFGPFDNHGDPGSSFWPEEQRASCKDSVAAIRATGGTIWLWHPYDSVTAWLPKPAINTTWYAFTGFRSNVDTAINLWIGFKDLSRSGADASPPAGWWDEKKSKIWMNGDLIPPPVWQNPGRPAGALDEPMTDEGYYYRPPTIVRVKKGWNNILVKLPLKTFEFNDWQSPPKWMFTVMPVRKGQGRNWDEDKMVFQPDNE